MFEGRTREAIKAEMLAELNTSSGLNALEGGFADQCFGPTAVALEKVYMTMDAVVDLMAVDASCGWLIDIVADNFSITRKEGAKATASAVFAGTPGAAIEKGTLLATQSGLLYALTEAVVLDETGAGTGMLEAQETGAQYNVQAGAVDHMLVNPTGVESVNVGPATGGVDTEGDEALVKRYYDKLRRPATSSNPNDYRKWAMEVPGVAEAKVIPLVNGAGTVGVTLVDEDFGPVEPDVVELALENIQKNRAVGLDQPPVVKSATAKTINVTVASKLDKTTTTDRVAVKLREALGAYCKALVAEKYARVYDGPEDDGSYTLSYNRVATLFMTIPGVLDHTALSINGAKTDVVIGKDDVPVVGEVSVT